MKGNHSQRPRYFSSIIVSMVAVLYLLFSIGIVKATHLCMGREAAVSYFTFESKKCACSLLAGEKDDCCDDTHEVLKLKDSQKHLSNFELPVPVFALLGAIYATIFILQIPHPGASIRFLRMRSPRQNNSSSCTAASFSMHEALRPIGFNFIINF